MFIILFRGNTIQQLFPNDSELPKMIGESVRKDDAILLEKLIRSKSLKDDKYCHLIQGKASYLGLEKPCL